MYRIVKEQPSCFTQLNEPFDLFMEGYDGNGPYGAMAIKFDYDRAIIHMEITRFALSVFKLFAADWEGVKDVLKARGVKTAIACAPPDNTKMQRIWVRFGFSEPQILAVSLMEI